MERWRRATKWIVLLQIQFLIAGGMEGWRGDGLRGRGRRTQKRNCQKREGEGELERWVSGWGGGGRVGDITSNN